MANFTETEPFPATVEHKKQMLLKNGIALWDIIRSCEIDGSRDSSIANITPNDLSAILNNSAIEKIFANGTRAHEICKKYSIDSVKLPSTSPANATHTLEKLMRAWSVILDAQQRNADKCV
jgi:hypoxanthine-DNA glycosylase